MLNRENKTGMCVFWFSQATTKLLKPGVRPEKGSIFMLTHFCPSSSRVHAQKKKQKNLQSHKNMEFQRPASGLVTAGYVTKQTRFRILTSGASGFVTQKEDTCVGFKHSNMIYGLLFFFLNFFQKWREYNHSWH